MGANSLRLGSYQKHNLAGADTQNDWFRYVLLGAVQNGRVFSTAPPRNYQLRIRAEIIWCYGGPGFVW